MHFSKEIEHITTNVPQKLNEIIYENYTEIERMSTLLKMFLVIVWCAMAVLADAAGSIESFFKRPLYAQPVATILGTGTNGGWYQGASVDEEFGWGFALPISLIFVNGADRKYSDSFTDEQCVKCRAMAAGNPLVDCADCIECTEFTAPTLFGTMKTPVVDAAVLDLRHNVIGYKVDTSMAFESGVPEVAEYTMVPFATLQASLYWKHTALLLRYIGIPGIMGVSFHFPGIGLQHDISRFLPDIPLHVSLAGHMTFMNASWKIKDINDASGTLKLSGMSNFLGVLAGFRPGFAELFLEMGWEHSFLKPGGEVTVDGQLLQTGSTIPGRNGVRAALNVSLPVKYHPVVGLNIGSQIATQLNLISFKSKKE